MKELISDEEINALPLRLFEGQIIVVEDKCDLPNIIEHLSNQKTLGFDTETKPAFQKGVINSVALLQISTNDTAYLFRLNKLGLPHEVVDIFQNPNITKVGLAIRDDLKALKKLTPFEPVGFVELQNLAKQKGYQDASLKKLAASVCDFRISKRQRLTNWESAILTQSQLLYAATDAWVALQIFNQLNNSQAVLDHHSFQL